MSEIVPMVVSIADAVRACGLGKSFLYREISAGRLRVRKAGRRTLLEMEELQRFIKSLPGSER
jgi:excisionase family DNA binding protein